MVKEKEIPLKVEVFAHGDDDDFLIYSQTEILNILQTIAERKSRVALYYDEESRFSLTLVVGVSAEGVWLDPAPRGLDNQHIIESKRVIFVSIHNHAKVQFVTSDARLDQYGHHDALFFPFPKKILRLQRRDFFRLATYPVHQLKCVIQPVQNKQKPIHKLTVMDISVGGVSLVCQESEFTLLPGHVYPNCQIDLPDVGVLNATLQVKNAYEVTNSQGQVFTRAGCVFVKPDGKTTMLLQRFVALMQREAATKAKA